MMTEKYLEQHKNKNEKYFEQNIKFKKILYPWGGHQEMSWQVPWHPPAI